MPLLVRLLPLFASALFFFSNFLAAYALDEPEDKLGPLAEYCRQIKSVISTACGSKIAWDKVDVISIALDDQGKVVDTKVGNSPDQKKADLILRGIKGLPAPPPDKKRPFWLRIEGARDPEQIYVSVRDINFQPYMENVQRRIKRNWFPPKGQETRRVQVSFVLSRSGMVSGLKVDKGSGFEESDKAALAAVSNVGRFENLPDGSPNHVDIQFTFDYNCFNSYRKGTGAAIKIPQQTFTPHTGAALCIKNGQAALESKNYAVAVQFYERALSFDKENETAKKGLSNTYKSLGVFELKADPTKAMADFKKAKEYWPEDAEIPETLEQAQALYGQQVNAGIKP